MKVTGKKAPAKHVKKMKRMVIEPADNGGHTVTHRMQQPPRQANQPYMMDDPEETNVFGPKDHSKMMAHVKGLTQGGE